MVLVVKAAALGIGGAQMKVSSIHYLGTCGTPRNGGEAKSCLASFQFPVWCHGCHEGHREESAVGDFDRISCHEVGGDGRSWTSFTAQLLQAFNCRAVHADHLPSGPH